MKTIAALGVWLTLLSTARADDGAAIMRKMQAAYTGLNSYSHVLSATMQIRAGDRTRMLGNTAEARYRKPNQLYVSVTSPQTGTIVVACNGETVLMYQSKSNRYRRIPIPKKTTEAGLVTWINKLGIKTMLDPLYFLAGGKLPEHVSSYRAAGTAAVNGVPCKVVIGNYNRPGMPAGAAETFTWWIDARSSLIRKVQIATRGVPVIIRAPKKQRNGKTVIEQQKSTADEIVTELVQDLKANPPLDSAAFSYTPPPGATEAPSNASVGKK